jgi:peptide/nickel transport system substrate-binding protein
MPAGGAATDRYLTTVLMTDIVGSTEHAAELGDSAWRQLVQVHHRLVRAALRRQGGREVDTAGDGFFATFDAPAAAVACALEIVDQVAALGIEIRAGLHVGEVEQSGRKVAGITVPIAARIMSLAEAGEVLVSGTVRDLVTGAGLRFEPRGSQTLKGVPGEWAIFVAQRTQPATAAGADRSAEDSVELRAAAVRRARSRPVWQRRPQLVATILAGLALVVVAGGLLVWQPWLPPALAGIGDDSVGVIDATRGAIVSSIKVDARPGGIAIGEGAAWVTNTGSDSVSRIDLAVRNETKEVDVGRAPIGIAIANGSVWVANSGGRTVTRINAAAARDVAQIAVGNGPTGIAASGDSVWVANFSDSTVVRIDATTGRPDEPIPVAAGPLAIAVDDHGIWVLSADGAAITHLDPATGVTLAAPIALSSRPTAISAGAGAVWVASADGTVTRIDPAADRVTTIVDIGGSLSGIAATQEGIWVADRQGYVYKLTPASPSSPSATFLTTSSPEALSVAGNDVWVAARSSPSNHRGGTLRIAFIQPPWVDPLDFPITTVVPLVADGLVGYRRVGGAAGNVLLPDLALSLPKPNDAGRTYTFQLRPGLRYSNGTQVNPVDFRRAIERFFQLAGGDATFQFGAIAGADKCAPVGDQNVERCDLSESILVDNSSQSVSYLLSRPEPDFLSLLATQPALPIPDGVPMNTWSAEALPGTGPYMVASRDDTQTTLVRNPYFSVWSDEVRPDGYPDEIIWTTADSLEAVAMVERGDADYTPLRFGNSVSADEFDRLRSQLTGQLHFASNTVTAVTLNATTPPFDNPDVRRALSLAIDRAAVADTHEGPLAVSITCQVLPPGWPAYEPFCPYTAHPDLGGQWRAPDFDEARRLVSSSGSAGQTIVVGPTRERHASTRDYLVDVLRELGYNASADTNTDQEHVDKAWYEDRDATVGVWEFGNNAIAASQFLAPYTCAGVDPFSHFCDPDYDKLVGQARDLQATDAAAATAAWADVDGSDFASARVGNYEFNAAYQTLLDQLWVK